jgi:hypothetical protein
MIIISTRLLVQVTKVAFPVLYQHISLHQNSRDTEHVGLTTCLERENLTTVEQPFMFSEQCFDNVTRRTYFKIKSIALIQRNFFHYHFRPYREIELHYNSVWQKGSVKFDFVWVASFDSNSPCCWIHYRCN